MDAQMEKKLGPYKDTYTGFYNIHAIQRDLGGTNNRSVYFADLFDGGDPDKLSAEVRAAAAHNIKRHKELYDIGVKQAAVRVVAPIVEFTAPGIFSSYMTVEENRQFADVLKKVLALVADENPFGEAVSASSYFRIRHSLTMLDVDGAPAAYEEMYSDQNVNNSALIMTSTHAPENPLNPKEVVELTIEFLKNAHWFGVEYSRGGIDYHLALSKPQVQYELRRGEIERVWRAKPFWDPDTHPTGKVVCCES